MELKFLGTSAATPTLERNLPAVALKLDQGGLIIFDAGEDIQRRFEAAKLKFNVPTIVLISHLHGDHVIGLPGLLFNFHLNNRSAPLTIIGPYGIAAYLMVQYQTIGLHVQSFDVELYEVQPPRLGDAGESFQLVHFTQFLTEKYERRMLQLENRVLFSASHFQIKGIWLDHTAPTIGFRFEEFPLKGKFSPEMARKLGVPMGPLWKKMHDGKPVVLPNGEELDPVQAGIVSPKRPGRIIVYGADSGQCANLELIATAADYFISESTYLTSEEPLAIEKKHLTARMAAEIALKSGVKVLILTHFSSRYPDLEPFLEEARAIFPHVIAAEDLMGIEIPLPE